MQESLKFYVMSTAYATKSKELYLKAMDFVKGDEMTVLHVGLTLNYSVFLYEVMFDVKSACKMAEQVCLKFLLLLLYVFKYFTSLF